MKRTLRCVLLSYLFMQKLLGYITQPPCYRARVYSDEQPKSLKAIRKVIDGRIYTDFKTAPLWLIIYYYASSKP